MGRRRGEAEGEKGEGEGKGETGYPRALLFC